MLDFLSIKEGIVTEKVERVIFRQNSVNGFLSAKSHREKFICQVSPCAVAKDARNAVMLPFDKPRLNSFQFSLITKTFQWGLVACFLLITDYNRRIILNLFEFSSGFILRRML
jgi:hypothetical protein